MLSTVKTYTDIFRSYTAEPAAGNLVTFVYIVKAKNDLHAYICFVANTPGVSNEHKGSNGGYVKGQEGLVKTGGWVGSKKT